MNRRFLILIACISSLLFTLLVQALPKRVSIQTVAPSVLSQQLPTQLSTQQLSQLAKSITVKVLSGDTWGSGIVIKKQEQLYTILTNDHVLIPGAGGKYQIQTSDGRIYPASVATGFNFAGNDLALLQFKSSNVSYAVASLADSSNLAVGDEVFTSGFPADADSSIDRGFVFTMGQISQVTPQDFAGGYQIGYTNDIQVGMSGGPTLNHQGQVVGVNGLRKYPLWGNPYVFRDGSTANEAMREQMSQLSWAIPVRTFRQLAPQLSLSPVDFLSPARK
jgi:S1-C subfamily serine protease